ncbi:spectrin binding protein [Aureococcus anophagefferens]|uniref:Spectrin binding protein n=1 Tax=Aureococcus anophagefferens TaxID=44056 RepID=A0ABR1G2G7_AURAN|nr:major facilitator superfamily-like protein [Aureococcus anophagefferens]
MATAAFLAKVRAAGGWDKYVHEPRADLLALRQQLPSLRERGRASPSTVRAHERLFLNTSLPDEVFSHILAFWRTSRDY